MEDGWKYGDEVFLMPKVVEPAGEARSDYRICADIAERLGVGGAFTEGRTERDWVEWSLGAIPRSGLPDLPTLAEFEASNTGVHSVPVTAARHRLRGLPRGPGAHPLATPSGRIEIFSAPLHALNRPAEMPAVPKYLQEWESPFGPEAKRSRSRSSATTRWRASTRR